jgi:putative aldouronate transport system substrate-binding protein
MVKRKLLSMLLTAVMVAVTAAPLVATAETEEPITLTFLMDWNGGAYYFPDGFNDGAIAQEIIKKVGVKIVAETITSSETEKLAAVFASDDLPDITNGPFWSTNPGGEGELIKRAAIDGQLLGLNQYIDDYPLIKTAMTEGVAAAFVEQHLENADFAGERYIIPRKPGTDEDVTNWAYGVYARKDILESLGIAPESVTTEEALRDLLEKIKVGGFTDINGKPVIPAGNWHNGWSYDQYQLGFEDGGFTDWGLNPETGLIEPRVMLQSEIDRTLYMRNLIADGLYDAEALTQTDTMGKEKMATGRVATFGCHWPHMNSFFESTLYLTNPEMEYIPLGPILMLDGEAPKSVSRKGAFGFGALFLSSRIKYPEKALELIEFISSKEGQLLVNFGFEGTHYNMVDGIPVLTDEWKKIKAEDQQRYYLEGFGYSQLNADDYLKSWGWSEDYNKPGYVHAREVRPLAFFDGFTAGDIQSTWPGIIGYNEEMATVNYEDLKKVAMSADSDAEAIQIIEDYRAKMRGAGYDEMIKFVNDKIAEDPSIVY